MRITIDMCSRIAAHKHSFSGSGRGMYGLRATQRSAHANSSAFSSSVRVSFDLSLSVGRHGPVVESIMPSAVSLTSSHCSVDFFVTLRSLLGAPARRHGRRELCQSASPCPSFLEVELVAQGQEPSPREVVEVEKHHLVHTVDVLSRERQGC